MTPLHQIKRLAETFVFNQFLYPRESLISDSTASNHDEVSEYLIKLLGNEATKIAFALDWCKQHPGLVLDLANSSKNLVLALVNQDITTFSLENCPFRINSLRSTRELLKPEKQSFFQIYPLEFTKFEIDETYQTVFASHQALEQSETEFTILGILRNVLAHLTPDGSFFVEVHNLDYLENQWNFRECIWRYVSDQLDSNPKNRIWEKTYPGTKESQTTFEVAVAKNLTDFSIYRSTLHLFNVDQWMKLFEVAGFIIEDCYGSWQKTPVTAQLPQLIFHLKVR